MWMAYNDTTTSNGDVAILFFRAWFVCPVIVLVDLVPIVPSLKTAIIHSNMIILSINRWITVMGFTKLYVPFPFVHSFTCCCCCCVVLCCVHLPVIESYRSTCKMMGLQHCDFHHCRCRHTIDDQTTGTMVEDLYSNGGKEGDSIGRAPFVPHFIGQVHIDVALHSSLWCDHHVIMGASNRSFQLLLHLVWWLPIDRYIYTHMCMCCHLLTIHIQQYGDVRQSPPSI